MMRHMLRDVKSSRLNLSSWGSGAAGSRTI